MNLFEEARQIYRKGIEVATRLKDLKAKGELEGVLDMLGWPSPTAFRPPSGLSRV
ncbi:MAG: hypothetical protein U0V70_04650 [Terriglobia bacterium]